MSGWIEVMRSSAISLIFAVKSPFRQPFSLALVGAVVPNCRCSSLRVAALRQKKIDGMLEMVSLNGNVVSADDGQLYHHPHALFSFKKDGQHGMAGGHLKSTTVLYTAEIELRPTVGGSIG